MIRALNRFITVRYNYGNPIVQQRALNLLRMSFGVFIVISLLLIALIVQTILTRGTGVPGILSSPTNYVGLPLFFAVYWLIQRGRLQTANFIFIGFLMYAILPYLAQGSDPLTLISPSIVVIAAGLLLRRRGFFVVFGIVIFCLVLRYLYMTSDAASVVRYIPAAQASTELTLMVAMMVATGLFLMAFSGTSEVVVDAALDDLKRLNLVSRFSSELPEVSPEAVVYTRMMQIAQHDLGYELVQVYLPDSDGNYSRQLRLTFGGAPRKIALTQSDLSVLTEALRTRAPVLVNWRETNYRAEHLIPPARQSVSLALVENDTAVAVLDVQTSREPLISSTEVNMLTSLVAQAARELAYGSTIRDLQATVRDQEGVISRYTRQLSEIQGRGRLVSASGWERYFEGRSSQSFGYDLVSDNGSLTPMRASDLPETIRDTILRGEVHVGQTGGEQIVTVPILFRDVVLGAISFNVPPERPVTERQIDMIRTVADRLSVALENTRLLEQTQAQARREHQASEIGSVLLSATNVETVLNLAANSFQEALGAVHTRVYLQPGTLIKSGDAT
jgi:GAF domain-containing protein